MIKLDKFQIESIKNNENKIKQNDFNSFYKELHFIGEVKGKLTDFFMIDCDINLWEYLDRIPSQMFELSVQEYVNIPDKYDTIPMEMFGYSELKAVNIPKKVEIIEERAFIHCVNLENMLIPDTVKRIMWGAFSECINLKEINIPANIHVSPTAFFGCSENLMIAHQEYGRHRLKWFADKNIFEIY